jgi:hypothetical protein
LLLLLQALQLAARATFLLLLQPGKLAIGAPRLVIFLLIFHGLLLLLLAQLLRLLPGAYTRSLFSST